MSFSFCHADLYEHSFQYSSLIKLFFFLYDLLNVSCPFVLILNSDSFCQLQISQISVQTQAQSSEITLLPKCEYKATKAVAP